MNHEILGTQSHLGHMPVLHDRWEFSSLLCTPHPHSRISESSTNEKTELWVILTLVFWECLSNIESTSIRQQSSFSQETKVFLKAASLPMRSVECKNGVIRMKSCPLSPGLSQAGTSALPQHPRVAASCSELLSACPKPACSQDCWFCLVLSFLLLVVLLSFGR